MRKFSLSKGQTLIELLASFSVAVVLVSAIAIAIISALSNTQFSKNRSVATQYSQSGIEMIRQMRNNDFAAFDGLSDRNYCLDKRCPGITDSLRSNPNCWTRSGARCELNIDNIFIREVEIVKDSSSCLIEGTDATKVTVSTLWSDSKCKDPLFCHSAKLVSCFSNSNVVPSPGENPTPVPLAAPQGLSTIVVVDSIIRLTWNSSTGATSYKVYRCQHPCTPTEPPIVNIPALTYDDGVPCGNRLTYSVKASNGLIDSPMSGTVITQHGGSCPPDPD